MTQPVARLHPVEDRTLRAQVHQRILDMVLSGRVAPGAKLTEPSLAEQLQVSRAPLREALRELVDQGILVSQPYKGLRVRPVSRTDLKELYSMRSALEKFAFTLTWPLRDAAAFADLDGRYDQLMATRKIGDQARAIEREIAFHSWVYDTSGHGLLQRHWARLSSLVRIYMSLHHNLHGAHGVFGAMTTEYWRLAKGENLDRMLGHIDDHMAQGFDSVVKTLPDAEE
ncbi:MAG: GntR family transcriptional regulator [Pseudomonadota bacterium]